MKTRRHRKGTVSLIRNRSLLILFLLCLSTFVVYHVAQQRQQSQIAANAQCTISDKLVNSCRPWLGAWAAAYPQAASGIKNQILFHEQRIGRQVDLVKDYLRPGNTLSATDLFFINRPN